MGANLLLELAPIHGRWTDSDGGIWTDSNGGIWEDGVSILASQEGFSGNRWWGDYIISVDPPQYQLASIHGGYCSLGWGSVTLAQEAFNDIAWWPPIKKLPCVFYFTTSTEDSAEKIFDGTAHLAEWDRSGITYELHGNEYNTDLLEEATNYDGDTVSLPRAFGNVSFQVPVRLADAGGKPTYHKAYVTRTVNTDWHIYDDGIAKTDITDNGDGTFSLDTSSVGEVSISGTGEISTLDELFTWSCGSSKFNIGYDNDLIESSPYDLSYWAGNQAKLIDFLSDVSAYFTHLFYIYENILYIVDMNEDNGSSTYTENDVTPVQYIENSPTSLYKTKWSYRESFDGRLADGSTTTYYVRETEKETSLTTSFSYGKEVNIEPFVETKTEMDSKLSDIKTIIEKTNVVGIPMEVGDLPVPGKLISWNEGGNTDNGPHILGINGAIRARTIIYDFKNYIVNITGEGVLTPIDDGSIMDEMGEGIGDGFGYFIQDGT